MSVPFKAFERWANSRFGSHNVKVSGKEIQINSIFESDDDGHHLWCSPSGGKKKRKNGTFHCWKSGKKGSLVKLVMLVERCDRDEAMSKLYGTKTIRELEQQLDKMFSVESEAAVDEPTKKPGLSIPDGCQLITAMPQNSWWRGRAISYLEGRKIPAQGLYVGTDGRYRSRILIPYYDRNGELVYYNGRHLGESSCKYLGPPKEIGVGKEDVVFMAGPWPEAGSTVHICEGEFNAMSMRQAELNAAACGGKNMSEKQALMLSEYKIVLCLDRDRAGKAGTTKMSSVVAALGSAKGGKDVLSFVIPPAGYNDWNQFLVKNSAAMLHHYVRKNQRPLDYSGPHGTTGDYFGFSDIWR